MTSTRLVLAQSVGQHHRAAHHLVGVAGINAQPHVHFDRLVKLGEFDLLDERESFLEGIGPLLNLLRRSGIFFAWFSCHDVSGPNGPALLAVARKASQSLVGKERNFLI
jgi:hypothetical protein